MAPSHVLPPELLPAPRNSWDTAVQTLLAALLVFMPMSFGAVEAWSELAVVAGAAALALCVAARTAIDRTFRPIWTWAYVPLGLFLLLATLQLLLLPTAWVEMLSPGAVGVRTELLGTPGDDSQWVTISMYPLATAHGLRMALVGTAFFFVTASTFRTVLQVKTLLLIVFVVGCGEAMLALMQIVTNARQVYWTFDWAAPRLTSGSFVNYSNFSQFMNLSLGAGLGLLLVRLMEERRDTPRTGKTDLVFGGASLRRHWWLLAGMVVCAVSIVTSMSRNGAISLVASGVVVGSCLYARGALSQRGWLVAVVPLGVAAAVVLFALDPVYARLATLGGGGGLHDRWQLTLGVLGVWRVFPVWGAGLGAHEAVFPMFELAPSRHLAGHADNDYAQLLEETGLIGAVCVAALLTIICISVIRLCRYGKTPLSVSAFGLGFGLLAVAIQSASDFGQHLPAIFCLSAVICGLIVQIQAQERQALGTYRKLHTVVLESYSFSRRIAPWASLATVIAISTWAVLGAYRNFVAEQWSLLALQIEERIADGVGVAADEDYYDLLAASRQAVDSEPGNVSNAYWLAARRWQAISADSDFNSTDLVPTSEFNAHVERIANELADVRRLCPTYGPPYALEGQLRLIVLDDARGSALIRRGVQLAPYDPPTCVTAGLVASREGRSDEGAALLMRAVAIDGSSFDEVAPILLFDLDRPDLAAQLAGEDYRRLMRLASLGNAAAESADFVADLHDRAEGVLRRRMSEDSASPSDLASLAAIESRRGDHQAAISLYRQALAFEYGRVVWRLELSRELLATNQIDEARREAHLCLRLRPGYLPAKTLIEHLQ